MLVVLSILLIVFFAAMYDNFFVPLLVIGLPLLFFMMLRRRDNKIIASGGGAYFMEKEGGKNACNPQNIRPVTREHPHARMVEGVVIEPDFEVGHLPDEMINWQAQRYFKERKLEGEFYRKREKE